MEIGLYFFLHIFSFLSITVQEYHFILLVQGAIDLYLFSYGFMVRLLAPIGDDKEYPAVFNF
jgi:hypothetical protein